MAAGKKPKSMTLTRDQVQRLATFFALDSSIREVTIEELYESGIGASHRAVFGTDRVERDYEADLTDVSVW